jgi:hypothetical protein
MNLSSSYLEALLISFNLYLNASGLDLVHLVVLGKLDTARM